MDIRISGKYILATNLLFFGFACLTTAGCDKDSERTVIDNDDDGYPEDEDCDDDNEFVHPDALEVCDGIDNDCDGETDEADAADTSVWYADVDGDNFGDDDSTVQACNAPADHVAVGGDCDDSSPAANPDEFETCDGIDNDCDDVIDEDAVDETTWYLDDDDDGYGDPLASETGCVAPPDYVDNDGDCDDAEASVNPDADELCDTVDNDCDDVIDEDDAVDASTWYFDDDGDTYGDPDASTTACTRPTGYVDNDLDCDDTALVVNPDGEELCDTVDNDCDDVIDEPDASDALTWYLDSDTDAYGDADATTPGCTQPTGYVANPDDCNDTEASVNPDADELCDTVDNDCDDVIDEPDASDAAIWYLDSDTDTYGDAAMTTPGCSQPLGYVDNSDDCDDTAVAVNPDATEMCDGIDNDCDGTVDEDDASDATTWYVDLDDDRWGVQNVSTDLVQCSQPAGYAADAGDCDDADYRVHPRGVEICTNGVDEDCAGGIDDWCAIEHCGTIAADETWTAAALGHVVTCDVVVQGTAHPTLTIEDGANVIFQAGTELMIGVGSYGSIDVQGITDGVVFDSEQASPAPGDWDGVYVGSWAETVVFEGLKLRWAGGNALGGLYLSHAGATLFDSEVSGSATHGINGYNSDLLASGSTFADNDGEGILLDANSTLIRGSGPTFVDNLVTGNTGLPMILPADYVGELDATSTFTGNGTDGIRILEDYVTEARTWQSLGVPFNASGHIMVAGVTLTVEDGVTIEFDPGTSLGVGYGNASSRLIVTGDPLGTGVLFTSSSDTPAPGDWWGVAQDSWPLPGQYTGLTVEYGGGNGYAGIYASGSDAVLDGCTVMYSSQSGLYTSLGGELRVSNSTFANNAVDGVQVSAGAGLVRDTSPTFTGNTLTGNGGYPLTLPANYVGEVDASSTFTGNVIDTIQILEDYVTDEAIWQSQDVPYRSTGHIMVSGAALTILDGVTVEFGSDTSLTVGYGGSSSQLIVEGDSTGAGVLFTSSSDTPAPGDWWGVGQDSWPQPGQYTGLTVEYAGANGYGGIYLNGSDAVLDDCAIIDSSNSGLYLGLGSEALVTDSTFENNVVDGVFVTSSAGLMRDTSPTFTGNTLTGNGGYPISLPANFVGELDASSAFRGNTIDAVRILEDWVELSATWQPLDVPFRATENVYVGGLDDPILTVADGVTVEFDPDITLTVGSGTYGGIHASGTTGGIVFTSSSDTPAAGDWRGLYFGSWCTDAEVLLDAITIEYGGSTGHGNAYFDGCDGSLTNSTIQYSSAYGVYLATSSTPDLTGNTYLSNALGDTN